MKSKVTIDEVLALAKKLKAADKVRLIGRLAPEIERDINSGKSYPRKSLWGLCSDLGTAPSAEEIDRIRREEWADFPRKDI